MYYLFWLILGLILGTILIYNVRSKGKKDSEKKIFSIGLIVAAGLYVGFSIIWGNSTWIFVELAGIPIFGSFVWLASRYSDHWLAIGWGFHTAWDGLIHFFGPGRSIAPDWYVVTCISFDLILVGYILFSDKIDLLNNR